MGNRFEDELRSLGQRKEPTRSDIQKGHELFMSKLRSRLDSRILPAVNSVNQKFLGNKGFILYGWGYGDSYKSDGDIFRFDFVKMSLAWPVKAVDAPEDSVDFLKCLLNSQDALEIHASTTRGGNTNAPAWDAWTRSGGLTLRDDDLDGEKIEIQNLILDSLRALERIRGMPLIGGSQEFYGTE